jgi:hypothetical protein
MKSVLFTTFCCNGPSTFGVNTCTRNLGLEPRCRSIENNAKVNSIYDNQKKRDAKTELRARC